MALLKQIKFGGASTPIAMTQVAIETESQKALSVVDTNTGLDVEANPLYTIALAVDGKTITKTGNDGLATALALKVEAASGEGSSAKKARIALVDSDNAELSSVNIEDIVGGGIISGTAYNPSTGKLTITWAGSTEQSPKTTVIDLAELLDFEDITIKSGSGDYLSFEKVSPAPGTDAGQAQIGVKLADVTYTATAGSTKANLTADTTNGKMLDASDAIPAIKDYVNDVLENASENLAVKAQGDDYVAASIDDNDNKKVIVATNKQDLTATAGSPGIYNASTGAQETAPVAGTLSGTVNSLADGADIAEKVKTYVDGAIAIEGARSDAKNKADIAALDATVGSQTVASGKHVAVEVVEADGVLTGLTVTEDNIASASDLTAEVNRAKAAEDEIAGKVGLTGTEGSRVFTPTTNYGGSATTVKGNLDALDTQLKTVSDKLAAVQYRVSGTTLEFFGMTENAGA